MQAYLVTNLVNGKMYVGKTTKPLRVRWREHVCCAKTGSRLYFHKALRKYGVENFMMESLDPIEYDITDEAGLNAWEMLMIRLLRVNCKLYNLTDGGEGVTGYRCSADTRRRISERKKRKECKHGHPLVGDNLYFRPDREGARRCKACAKNRSAAFQQKQNPSRVAGVRTRKSHCKYGHPRTADNLTKYGACRACLKISNEKWRSTHRDPDGTSISYQAENPRNSLQI